MGICYGRSVDGVDGARRRTNPFSTPRRSNGAAIPVHPSASPLSGSATPVVNAWSSPLGDPGSASPLPPGVAPSPSKSTLKGIFRLPFPPPSPAKHIKAALAKRHGNVSDKPKDAVAETGTQSKDGEQKLDKNFGYGRNFSSKYELEKEVGQGHFGNTWSAWAKKMKGQTVAVKVIPKAKMTTAISIEDVRREVKILKALSGHKNLPKFYDACEDALNVYIVMELCEGGELLDRILSRGGRYTEEDAKTIILQILNVVAYCHLQGVVHRDLKPENFLFATKDENALMKLIDFGLSDFVRPEQRLNDIVGSAYYVAPEVLHRSYSLEADMWSIGVITYILLCGSRPFWARTESGIFRSVLRADPNFDDSPWPDISPEARDFVKRLLNKDYRKRMTAVQALTHPWLRDEERKIPLDILVYKLVKFYLCATPLKHAALKAVSKALTDDDLLYLRLQFELLEPNAEGFVSLQNFQRALMQNVTDAMKEARVTDMLKSLEPLSYRSMNFEEFSAAAINIYQLEALERWEQIANTAFEYFESVGNRVISVEELSQELSLAPTSHSILKDWIRPSDGKLNLLGFTKYLHGITIRSSSTRQN